jgi:hypothetical protein
MHIYLSQECSRGCDKDIESSKFLWGPYLPGYYWMELLEIGRKFALTGLPSLIRLFCGERTGIDVGIGVLVSGAFAAYYSGVSPYSSTFDLVAMRPTQYMIMVTIACGVTKEYGGDNHFTDVVVTVLIIGLCSPLLLFLVVRLLKPDFADKVVQRLYLLRYYRERESLSMELKKVIDPIKNEGEGYYVLQEAIDGVFGSADSGPVGRARVSDAVKLFVENEKRKNIAGNYEELKHEALIALCEAVGIEIERLEELELRGLLRRNTEHMRSLSTEGILVNETVANINPMSGEIVGAEPHSTTIASTGAMKLPDSPTCDQDGVEMNSKNQRRREMQDQMSPYASRDSIARLSRVGGTKNKGEKKVMFTIGSSDRDRTWAPTAARQRPTQEKPAETEIEALSADARGAPALEMLRPSKADAPTSGAKLYKVKEGAAKQASTAKEQPRKAVADDIITDHDPTYKQNYYANQITGESGWTREEVTTGGAVSIDKVQRTAVI